MVIVLLISENEKLSSTSQISLEGNVHVSLHVTGEMFLQLVPCFLFCFSHFLIPENFHLLLMFSPYLKTQHSVCKASSSLPMLSPPRAEALKA